MAARSCSSSPGAEAQQRVVRSAVVRPRQARVQAGQDLPEALVQPGEQHIVAFDDDAGQQVVDTLHENGDAPRAGPARTPRRPPRRAAGTGTSERENLTRCAVVRMRLAFATHDVPAIMRTAVARPRNLRCTSSGIDTPGLATLTATYASPTASASSNS